MHYVLNDGAVIQFDLNIKTTLFAENTNGAYGQFTVDPDTERLAFTFNANNGLRFANINDKQIRNLTGNIDNPSLIALSTPL